MRSRQSAPLPLRVFPDAPPRRAAALIYFISPADFRFFIACRHTLTPPLPRFQAMLAMPRHCHAPYHCRAFCRHDALFDAARSASAQAVASAV